MSLEVPVSAVRGAVPLRSSDFGAGILLTRMDDPFRRATAACAAGARQFPSLHGILNCGV
jgi:hypothetical protein